MTNQVENYTASFSASTLDFEKHTATSPVLSSREAGWKDILVRTFHEPAQVEDITLPSVPDIHLVLVKQGAMHFESRDVNGPWEGYRVHENELFLTPAASSPYELRWHSLSATPICLVHIHLKKALLERSAEQIAGYDRANQHLKELSAFHDPLLAQIALALQQELELPTPAGQLYAETAAQMLAVHLLKHYQTKDIHVELPNQKLSRRQMGQLTDYILTHLADKLSLEVLAEQVGFSAYHFGYLFRQSTGQTPHQFVINTRLEHSQHLLRETDQPLSQVALAVGFQTQSHFTQAFKHRFGVTPRQYRQQS
ncbi:AraC family transcriptional regulator [Ktedonosporobacter rubrisoli]|uniref:AraC family transcriptional regulator n=1 Tax=Ktedonosporobacter rubrisoli TaxID=2509675 RepID=A0A4P6JWW2_KTERU|nr:AraC family transcriptional regulator [Ktedonosporobacter rubrisoli]QBD80209.1 AraC family transcriptional regulator [Ktedonosporobacter rubrisoli]